MIKEAIIKSNTEILKSIALDLGFEQVGISKAERLESEEDRLTDWLKNDYHGQMNYMSNHFDKRLDPTLLVPGAKSVISLMYNYYTDTHQADPNAPKISKYAYGNDYHYVIKDKLKTFLHRIEEKIGAVEGRVFTDSAPVMERSWAAKSGLGWQGKNTLLINKSKGSYYFLAELIIDLELDPDQGSRDHCGTCTRCIDACPTDAISPTGYLLDGSKCISYLTIELKDALPNDFKGKMENWMFGCDICQEVCPWNRFAHQHSEAKFEPNHDLIHMNESDWKELTNEVFKKVFKDSPVKRTKMSGLLRNINFLE